MTSTVFLLSALIPALSEEAIRSSFLWFTGDRGRRFGVVVGIACVFVIGEVIHDTMLLPKALDALSTSKALSIYLFALVSGILLHLAMTWWTMTRMLAGWPLWGILGLAVTAHTSFNLLAQTLMGFLTRLH